MSTTFEFRVNLQDNPQQWETLPVVATLTVDSDDPTWHLPINVAQALAIQAGEDCEVRVNETGSYQGHYMVYRVVDSKEAIRLR